MFKKSVNSVVARLTKIMTDLEDVANEAGVEADKEDIKIAEATTKRAEADAERNRATRIKEKLEELLG